MATKKKMTRKHGPSPSTTGKPNPNVDQTNWRVKLQASGRVGGSDVWLDDRLAKPPYQRLAPSHLREGPCMQHCGKPDRSCRI